MPSYEGEPNHSTHKRSISRVVSRETSKPNSSYRVYYGEAAGAVPFLWESHPGTPKHPLFDHHPSSLIPPLTPPPSFSAGSAASGKRKDFKPRLDLFVSSILTRASRSQTRGRSFSSSSSSSSASWSSHGSSARDGYSGDIPARESSSSSPTSTLCFPVVKRSAWRMVSGCYTVSINVKNAGKIRA